VADNVMPTSLIDRIAWGGEQVESRPIDPYPS